VVENTAHLSALLHLFSGKEGQIAIQMLIDHHYLSETRIDGKTALLINPRMAYPKM